MMGGSGCLLSPTLPGIIHLYTRLHAACQTCFRGIPTTGFGVYITGVSLPMEVASLALVPSWVFSSVIMFLSLVFFLDHYDDPGLATGHLLFLLG